MPVYRYGYCQHCNKEFKDFSQGRVNVVVKNHEMICHDNPKRKKNGLSLDEALQKAREELGEW